MEASSSSSSSSKGFMENVEQPHVLAVDDSIIDRKLIEKLLKNLSCKVTTAENGPRALEFLGLGDHQPSGLEGSVSKVNLVITDYCMPGMTGYELLKKIKESSIMKEVPVVLRGGSSDVHAKAPQTVGHKEIEMSFDELQELKNSCSGGNWKEHEKKKSDVIGVEVAGAIKNVLAIAAGIVDGMNLGNNCKTALVAQNCSATRWLATKIGATTITGLSGIGDIMLTCFVNLSRNRTVGVRLGSGEQLDDILSSMNQVAEGVSTAGAVIAQAQKYNVQMPVLTAVARIIIDNELTPKKAVLELMSLPQVEEV